MYQTIKKLGFLILVMLTARGLQAQFTQAHLQASGLTCALCSRAVDKALSSLPFVLAVSPDIRNSSFAIQFRPGTDPDPDALRKAVEEAGFSVARLSFTVHFQHFALNNDSRLILGNRSFNFVRVQEGYLEGDQQIILLDKNFLSPAAFKKWVNKVPCLQPGDHPECKERNGVAAGTRIYHVTI